MQVARDKGVSAYVGDGHTGGRRLTNLIPRGGDGFAGVERMDTGEARMGTDGTWFDRRSREYVLSAGLSGGEEVTRSGLRAPLHSSPTRLRRYDSCGETCTEPALVPYLRD